MPSVYFLISSMDYEGCSMPVGVYTSRRKAKSALKVWNKLAPSIWDNREIIRMPLDKKPVW